MSDAERAEAGRVEAEAERKRQEELRRINEGGPDNGEAGRVEAEEERVVAEERRSSLRRFYLKMAGSVSLPLAFLALLPAGIGLYLVNARADDNMALIRQAEEDRVENRARFKRSDVLLCREIEQLKAQNRDDAYETFNSLDRTLRILGLTRTKEIEDVALENLAHDLSRNKARTGGCGDLPSVGAGG